MKSRSRRTAQVEIEDKKWNVGDKMIDGWSVEWLLMWDWTTRRAYMLMMMYIH